MNLSKGNTFMGQHILVPKEGVAVHINAFNFPVWGMLEKIAVNLLAGVPAVVKPATITSFLTETVVREIAASGILPPGALQLICGSAGDLLDHVGAQDVVTFTGSASTGLQVDHVPASCTRTFPSIWKPTPSTASYWAKTWNPACPNGTSLSKSCERK